MDQARRQIKLDPKSSLKSKHPTHNEKLGIRSSFDQIKLKSKNASIRRSTDNSTSFISSKPTTKTLKRVVSFDLSNVQDTDRSKETGKSRYSREESNESEELEEPDSPIKANRYNDGLESVRTGSDMISEGDSNLETISQASN